MKKNNDLREVSDGYHTFNELYGHRIALFIALCKKICNDSYLKIQSEHNPKYHRNDEIMNVWRSKKHSDGTMFDGWFIMGINKCKGKQISYHLPLDKWELTDFAETLEFAPEWDGHTSDDVIKRLLNY